MVCILSLIVNPVVKKKKKVEKKSRGNQVFFVSFFNLASRWKFNLQAIHEENVQLGRMSHDCVTALDTCSVSFRSLSVNHHMPSIAQFKHLYHMLTSSHPIVHFNLSDKQQEKNAQIEVFPLKIYWSLAFRGNVKSYSFKHWKNVQKPSSFSKNIILSLPCMLIKNIKIKFITLKLYLLFCKSISTTGATRYGHL